MTGPRVGDVYRRLSPGGRFVEVLGVAGADVIVCTLPRRAYRRRVLASWFHDTTVVPGSVSPRSFGYVRVVMCVDCHCCPADVDEGRCATRTVPLRDMGAGCACRVYEDAPNDTRRRAKSRSIA